MGDILGDQSRDTDTESVTKVPVSVSGLEESPDQKQLCPEQEQDQQEQEEEEEKQEQGQDDALETERQKDQSIRGSVY